MKYDKNYFTEINYTDYLEREDRYKKLAKELIHYSIDKGVLKNDSKILDYGCAVGFLVSGFRSYGFKCEGYDVSKWAKEECKKKNINYIQFKKRKFDIMFSLDVFEHMTDSEICKSLLTFDPDYLFVRIPCSTDGGKTFHLNVSKKDSGHINCKTKIGWDSFLYHIGYEVYSVLDLYTIYDTDGVMCKVYSKKKI